MNTDKTEESGAEEHALEEDGASGVLEGLVIEFQGRISSCCPYNCIVIYNREDLNQPPSQKPTLKKATNSHQNILQENSSTQDTKLPQNHTTATELKNTTIPRAKHREREILPSKY